MMLRLIIVAVAVFAFGLARQSTNAAEWSQFRGPNSSGVNRDASPPTQFGPTKTVAWKVPVGAGHSSPCIAGDSLFLTTEDAATNSLSLVAFNRHTGERRWSATFVAEAFEKGHPSFNAASSSPVTDGQYVVAYFGSYGLVCCSVEGEVLWEHRMPITKSFGGNATSPIIVGDRVILYRGNYVDHFLAAYDTNSGDELWNVPQHEEINGEMACTACPIVVNDSVIVHTARAVQCYRVGDGSLRWITNVSTTATSTPIIVGDQVYIAAWNKLGEPSLRPEFPSFETLLSENDKDDDGTISRDELPRVWVFHRPDGTEAPMNGMPVRFKWTDTDRDGEITAYEWSEQLTKLDRFRAGYQNHGLIAISLTSEGTLSIDDVTTLVSDGIPEVPSPVSDGRFIYLVKNGGVLSVIDVASGERVSRVRTQGRGTHYASPIIAGDHLFTTAGDGTISVLSLGERPQSVAVSHLDEPVYATPVAMGRKLYIRSHQHLYAFERAASPGGPNK